MINDNIANGIAYFLHESQDFSFRQLPPGWPPIPLLARRLSRLKIVVSTFQKSICRALNASAAAIQNIRVDHDITTAGQASARSARICVRGSKFKSSRFNARHAAALNLRHRFNF
jgi:hypothetical protein